MLATNWSTKSSHCSWYGISCNAPQQRVSAINSSNMGLEGTIAPQVGNLSFLLQQLNLFNNKLVGSIPEAICNLSKLEELYLGNNQLIGEIPKKMSNLLNLKILSFPMNNLTGSIPTTIFNMSSLLNISLSYNSLSGSLPMDICYTNLKLKELNLSSNHLSGKVPTGEIPQSLFNIYSLRASSAKIINQSIHWRHSKSPREFV
uniref:Leucine-rich repeat-containing N-terminal plant-type domain-containing protein n=1 Tax=Vitis vinifera TaxID=29760 RepID=F6HLX6_VITVI